MENINPKTIKFASKTFGEKHLVEVQLFYDVVSTRHDFRIHWEHGFNQRLSDASQFCETVTKALEFAKDLKDQLSGKESVPVSCFDRVEQIKQEGPAGPKRSSVEPARRGKKTPGKNPKDSSK